MKKAIIIGAGTYGQVYAEYLKEYNIYDKIEFLDDDPEKQHNTINNIKVIGPINMLESISDKNNIDVYIPIGNNKLRLELFEYVEKLGFETPNFIHKNANIHRTTRLGKGVYILPFTNIMPLVDINNYVMISMGVNIAHHTIIRDGSFISQGVNVGASININHHSFLGIGSTIMTGVKEIGKNSIIGAGSVIIRNVPANTVVIGNPGRVIRENDIHEK